MQLTAGKWQMTVSVWLSLTVLTLRSIRNNPSPFITVLSYRNGE